MSQILALEVYLFVFGINFLVRLIIVNIKKHQNIVEYNFNIKIQEII